MPDRAPASPPPPPVWRKIISWNLLRLVGASREDVARLIEAERPDLLLMQEATQAIDGLCDRAGGTLARAPLPGRVHGPAIWSSHGWPAAPSVLTLPSGTIVHRVCQILDLGDFAIANVHLSHGQMLNRRQLRRIAQHLPAHAAVLGDYNLIGPALLPGFRDVGPRRTTHRMGNIVPLRIDRCLVRGLACRDTAVLPRGLSDHHPIVVHLALAPPRALAEAPERVAVRDTAASAARRRRAAGSAAFAPAARARSGAGSCASA